MKSVIEFLEDNLHKAAKISASRNSSGRTFLRFEEQSQNAAVKKFDLFIPVNGSENFYAFKVPENLEIKKLFPQYNYSCDFVLFHALEKIIMLLELKGEKLAHAKKQIKYTIPFVSYIFKLFEIEKNKTPNYKIKRVIVSYNKRRVPNTNLKNSYSKRYEEDYIILYIPSSYGIYEWKNLL